MAKNFKEKKRRKLAAWNWSVECYRNFLAPLSNGTGVHMELLSKSFDALRKIGLETPVMVSYGD